MFKITFIEIRVFEFHQLSCNQLDYINVISPLYRLITTTTLFYTCFSSRDSLFENLKPWGFKQQKNNILTYAGRWNKDRTDDLLERVQAVTNSAYTKTDGGVSLHSFLIVYRNQRAYLAIPVGDIKDVHFLWLFSAGRSCLFVKSRVMLYQWRIILMWKSRTSFLRLKKRKYHKISKMYSRTSSCAWKHSTMMSK